MSFAPTNHSFDNFRISHAERREIRERIALSVRDGLTVQQAADKFNVTQSHVRRCCRENGVKVEQ